MNIEDEKYEKALGKYLDEGINYDANTIKNADDGDLRQLASDSFYYGVLYAIDRYKCLEMFEMLKRIHSTMDKGTQTYIDIEQLLKEATAL